MAEKRTSTVRADFPDTPYELNAIYTITLGHVMEARPEDRPGYAFRYLRYAITAFTPAQVHAMGAALASVVGSK